MERKCYSHLEEWRKPTRRKSSSACCYHYQMKKFLWIIALFGILHSSTGVEAGADDNDRGGRAVREAPCVSQDIFALIRYAFQKLVPSFNSRAMIIQLRTDYKIQLGPDNPNLVPFLIQYYSTTLGTIQNEISRGGELEKTMGPVMSHHFSKEYSQFLRDVGLPLACLSYILGITDTASMIQLQRFSQGLQRQFESTKVKNNFHPLFADGTKGEDIADMLNIRIESRFAPEYFLSDGSRDAATCEQLLLYLKDGSIMVKLPILNLEMKSLDIPTTPSHLNLDQIQVTHQLGRYIATGLACLDNSDEKINFIMKVIDWISTNVMPQIIKSQTCSRGLEGILPFMASIKEYSKNGIPVNSSAESQRNNTHFKFTLHPHRTVHYTSNESVWIHELHGRRRRRSLPQVIDEQSKIQKALKRYTRQLPGPGPNSRQDYGGPRGQHLPELKINYENGPHSQQEPYHGRFEEEKKLYDDELLHLYNKLNNHFLHHHMKIARLDVLHLPDHPRFKPIYFHSTTTRHTTKRTTTTRRITKPTTTPTTPTTTRPKYMQYPLVPVGHSLVKIVGEVNVDENKLSKPVSVRLAGNKLNAQLNVFPKDHPAGQGPEIIFFQENLAVSNKKQPEYHFQSKRHQRNKEYVKPMHLRKHILYRQTARDSLPHNPVDQAIDNGIKSVSNFAQSILPAVFKPPKQKSSPSYHTFDKPIPKAFGAGNTKGGPQHYRPPPPSPNPPNPIISNKVHSKYMRKGLQDLLKTDQEIPRRI